MWYHDTMTHTNADDDADPNVMGAIDEGATEQYVIADVSRDEAWLSASLTDSRPLAEWA